MRKIKEVSFSYVCNQNLQHIDAYFSDDQDDEGKTIAVVCRDTKKVISKDSNYFFEEEIQKAIMEVVDSIA